MLITVIIFMLFRPSLSCKLKLQITLLFCRTLSLAADKFKALIFKPNCYTVHDLCNNNIVIIQLYLPLQYVNYYKY